MYVIPAIYFLLIFSALSTTLQFKIAEYQRNTLPDRVQHNVTQLALAYYRHYTDAFDLTGRLGAYPADINDLTTSTPPYLSFFNNETVPGSARNRYEVRHSGTTPAAPTLEIRYEADSEGEAARIVNRLGPVAELVATPGITPAENRTVRITFADPLDISLMTAFLRRDGRDPMLGDLNMNGNNISGVATLEATTVNAETIEVNIPGPRVGTIRTENIESLTGAFDDILINP